MQLIVHVLFIFINHSKTVTFLYVARTSGIPAPSLTAVRVALRLKSPVFLVLLYDCEAWILNTDLVQSVFLDYRLPVRYFHVKSVTAT